MEELIEDFCLPAYSTGALFCGRKADFREGTVQSQCLQF